MHLITSTVSLIKKQYKFPAADDLIVHLANTTQQK